MRRKDGYKQFSYEGKRIYNHRFLYENYHNVKLKTNEQINHIDLNRSNNSIRNLEIVTHQQNQHHILKQKNNTSGYKNIYHEQKKQKSGKIDYYYRVKIYYDGKKVCQKSFNKENPDALQQALKFRDNFLRNFNEKHNTNFITDESFEILQLMNLYNIFSE